MDSVQQPQDGGEVMPKKAMRVPRKLTDEEAKKLTKQYQRLGQSVEKITSEQILLLKTEIEKDKKLSDPLRAKLLAALNAQQNPKTSLWFSDGYKPSMFRVTDANVLQKPHTQLAYDIDDDLYTYLRQPESELPKRLIGFLDDGADISAFANKAIATDLMPQTGKTKTGVPQYDSLLKKP